MSACVTCSDTRRVPAGPDANEDEVMADGKILCPDCESSVAITIRPAVEAVQTGLTEQMPDSDGDRYDFIRERLNGGYLEAVHLPEAPGVLMLVDEEGKIKNEPLNGLATLIFAYGHGIDISKTRTVAEIAGLLGDIINGPAVLIGEVPHHPRTLGLYPEALAWVQHIIDYGKPPAKATS